MKLPLVVALLPPAVLDHVLRLDASVDLHLETSSLSSELQGLDQRKLVDLASVDPQRTTSSQTLCILSIDSSWTMSCFHTTHLIPQTWVLDPQIHYGHPVEKSPCASRIEAD